MKYEYTCTQPVKQPNSESPVMSSKDIEFWLNQMDKDGWEFVGHAQKHWNGLQPFVQEWWIFRRLRK